MQTTTLEGLRRMLALHGVLVGRLSNRDAESVTRLAYLREASDYATDRAITGPEAEEADALAEPFLKATGGTPD